MVESVEIMLATIVLEEPKRSRRGAGARDVLRLDAASRAMLDAGNWNKYTVRATRRN